MLDFTVWGLKMLSRYFSFIPAAVFVSLSMVLVVGPVPLANANNIMLDSKGRPLPGDFGDLLQQLNQSGDERKRKILGLSSTVGPSQSTEATNISPESSLPVREKNQTESSEVDEGLGKAEKAKNPAFYNPELARRLYDALEIGDAARTKWLLQSGAGNVYINEKKDTSLRLAIRKRWASVVRVLLERDPDLDQELPGGVNLLHEASVQGAYDIAKMLIEAGLDPEEKTAKNWTNLHLAARYGHVDMVRYYLSLGLDPNARNSEGNTAHWLASHLRHYQAAGYLSSRTNVVSHQIFDSGQGSKKGKRKKTSRKSKKSLSQVFSPAQLEALSNL